MILNQSKYLIFIFAICTPIFLEIQSKTEDNFQYVGIRFKSVKCQSDNISIIAKYCYLKAISRKVVVFNLGLKLLVPYKKPFFGHAILYYRYGTIFRQIIDTKKLELCGILDGVDTNPLIRLIVDMVKSIAPNEVHNCPYEGDWDLRNFTLNLDLVDKATMLFSQGIYRWDYSSFYNNSKAFNVSLIFETKSPIKESFG